MLEASHCPTQWHTVPNIPLYVSLYVGWCNTHPRVVFDTRTFELFWHFSVAMSMAVLVCMHDNAWQQCQQTSPNNYNPRITIWSMDTVIHGRLLDGTSSTTSSEVSIYEHAGYKNKKSTVDLVQILNSIEPSQVQTYKHRQFSFCPDLCVVLSEWLTSSLPCLLGRRRTCRR